jgi:undecaprenyl diphosphate synthase
MDGNGRWACKRGLDRIDGHREGAESVRECMKFAVEKGIRYISFFAFSEENWERPAEEVEGLMHLMFQAIKKETPTMLEYGIRFRVIGDMNRLGDSLRKEIDECCKVTDKENCGTDMIIFLSYSGKWDIIQAFNMFMADSFRKGISGNPPVLDAGILSGYLSTSGIPDPDLLIRTSGEQRISNFMLWQTAYTEYYFTETLWPDFRKNDFARALEVYAKRDRRFGKLK